MALGWQRQVKTYWLASSAQQPCPSWAGGGRDGKKGVRPRGHFPSPARSWVFRRLSPWKENDENTWPRLKWHLAKGSQQNEFHKNVKKSMLPILCFLQATTPKWLRSGPGRHEFCESRVPLGSADHLPWPQPPNPLALGVRQRGGEQMSATMLPTWLAVVRWPWHSCDKAVGPSLQAKGVCQPTLYIFFSLKCQGVLTSGLRNVTWGHILSLQCRGGLEILPVCGPPSALATQGASMMKWLRQQHPISMGSMPRWPLVRIIEPWPLTHWSAAHRKPEVLNTPNTVCESTVMVKFLLYL